MSKGSGRSEGRKKKHRESTNEPSKPLMVTGNTLELEMELQKRDQQIKSGYEKDIAKMREMHQRELQNMSDGILLNPPRIPFWKRLFRRETDLYIVFNHNLPVYCHLKKCPTKRSGVNWGIEAVVLDLETAFWYISRYFEEFGKYPWCNAKILHLKINRRNRTGAIVQDNTWQYGDWDAAKMKDGIREMRKKV